MTTYEQKVRELFVESCAEPFTQAVKDVVTAIHAYIVSKEYFETINNRPAEIDGADIQGAIKKVKGLEHIIDPTRFDRDLAFLARLALALREWCDDIDRTNQILASPS